MNEFVLKNADLVVAGRIIRRDLRIAGTKIAGIGENLTGGEEIDLAGKIVMPGFIDTHTHGAVGRIYSKPEDDLSKITAFEATKGVTGVAAGLSSVSEENYIASAKNVLAHKARGTAGAKLLAIHAEGPFLNIKKKGGMKAEYIKAPDVEAFRRLHDACGGLLKIITVAPELDGAEELIRAAVAAGVKVSAGHTDADYDTMCRAIDAGVSRMTHTFNAARGINHREPGVVGAALCDARVTCEVICDFVHLHPAAVELIYKIKGTENFCAISDSVFCAGLPEGECDFDGRHYLLCGGTAQLADGTISGSAGDLNIGVKNLASLGIPLWEIAEMVSKNPAKALGMENTLGSIAEGMTADLAVLDSSLDVVMTIVDGEIVYKKQ